MDNDFFIDQYLNLHKFKKKLAEGGQGRVIFTENEEILIKIALMKGEEISDVDQILKYHDKIQQVRRLPLPHNLNLVKPLAVLKNRAGYVLKFLGEMQPILGLKEKNDVDVSQAHTSPVTSKIYHEFGKAGYQTYQQLVNTGGLRRRLILLSKLSSILARIHSHGLVYGDISHNNIFISKEMNHHEVWLIDADNICFSNQKTPCVYTPMYASLELQSQTSGIHIKSDDFALAVLIYEFLTHTTPWINHLQFNGEYFDGSPKPQKDIQSLWVDDPTNQDIPLDGLNRKYVMNDQLKRLFSIAFNDGYSNKYLRPCASLWAIELAKAADMTINCKHCQTSWLIEQSSECPFCHEKIDEYLRVDAYLAQQTPTHLWSFCHELSNQIELPERLLKPFQMQSHFNPVLELTINHQNMNIQKNELYASQFELQYLVEKKDRFFSKMVKLCTVYQFRDTKILFTFKINRK
jgi:serine/threonine protein kinase